MNKLIALGLALLISSPALAHEGRRVDRREARQGARIQRGVNTGQLTAEEAARLQAGQGKVGAMEAKARADGDLTLGEKAKLNAAQNRQNRRIFRQKHDLNR